MPAILNRLYHMHWITPEAARSAQPYLGFYGAYLRSNGFRSLINLRGPNADFSWWHAEKKAAGRLKIIHFDVRMSSRNLPTKAALSALFDAFENAPPPLLIKCSGGQDRAGLASALYILHRKGPAGLKAAEGQFALWPYLHRPKRHQFWLRHFPAYALGQAHGMPLSRWVREAYEQKHFAHWLEAHGMAGSFRAYQVDMMAEN